MDQSSAPALEALVALQARKMTGFGAPGHAAGRGATADVLALMGKAAFKADVLTPKGLDDRSETMQVLQRMHALAADAWGAKLCRYATGGSTQSLHTAIAAVARPGETVILASNCHKAEWCSALLAGVDPVRVQASVDPVWGIEHGVTADALEATLAAHPMARAVVVVSPTYFGVTSDIVALAGVCHDYGVPLIVDAAWGAAYGFNDRLPPSPIHQGADIVVVSVHKTMAALSQGSAMFVCTDRIDQERFALAYEVFETTSPSIPILASLDATRREHALHGRRVWDRVIDLAETTRDKLAAIPGVKVLERDRLDGGCARDLDVTKIALDIGALGVSPYDADDYLTREHQVSMGLSDKRHLLAVFSVGVTARDAHKLVAGVKALTKAVRTHPGRFPRPMPVTPAYDTLGFEMVMPAPEAFFARAEKVRYEDAAGRVAAEVIAPAPPGVARLIPGQRITPEHVAFLVASRDAGMFVLDPADPEQKTLRVVAA